MSSAWYSFSHNHGSGKRLYLKGHYYWRDPFLTSMIMGGRVNHSLRKYFTDREMCLDPFGTIVDGAIAGPMYWSTAAPY